MKIEILYPEFCNLFGDSANMTYLEKCLPQGEFIATKLNETPRFLREKMNLVYMGPMTENTQEKVIQRLAPHKQEIQEAIEAGTPFLFTGNALEVLGNYIENEDGSRIQGLGILDLWAKRDLYHRHNSGCLCEFEGMQLMGFKSQFTTCFPKTEEHALFHVRKGMGMNPSTKGEGIRIHNFMGTYLIGPLLILNPCFTKYLLDLMGAKNTELAFEQVAWEAYRKRLEDFEKKIPDEPEKYKYM
jgi:CobQ-like glutamine amidotransferase family enzyme